MLKKTPLLITLGILLLIVSGYLVYIKFFTQHPVSAWDLVPENTIAVYERDKCDDCVEALDASPLHQLVQSAALYNKQTDSIPTIFRKALKDRQDYLVSMHVTKKDDFDFVYYVPDVNGSISGLLSKSSLGKQTSRQFNTITIHELRFRDHSFSYAHIQDIWVGSYTPFLIEDVVRTFEARDDFNFRKNHVISSFTSIRDDAGNIYIHLKSIGSLMGIFVSEKLLGNYSVGKSSVLDVKTSNNSIVLNGFSSDSLDQAGHLLSVFRHQSPVTFTQKQLITNRALAVSSFGVSDGAAFSKDLRNFVQKHRPQLSDTLRKLSTSFHFDPQELYSHISDEFGVCHSESLKGARLAKILFIETDSKGSWLKSFNEIANRLSVDTVFFERYSQFEIREVPVFRFPEKLFWPFVTGFDQCFYTSIGNVILIADDLEELKAFLDDTETENTWGKSVAQNKFLETTLLESNLSLYFNASKFLTVFKKGLQPRWQRFMNDNQSLIKAFQMSSVQFSHLNNSYYTNALFTYKPVQESTRTNTAKEKLVVNFERGVYGIHAVKSHLNRTQEILVQDSLNDLMLLSSDGKAQWKIPIGDRIVSEVSQIDFFNNGKLQYFFSTPHDVHIIDRLGHYVEPFPLHLTPEVEFISIVDYDNSKRYRILVADKKGKLWMYDKEGNNLEGWSPKDVGGPLAMAARHHRIKGKDYIVAIRKDGKVFLMNRRGETLKNFPMDSEGIPVGDYYLEQGSTIRDTYFVVVSRDGYKIRFTIEGKVQNREALLKNSIHSVFSLIREQSGKSYLVLEQDGKQMSLFDDAGKKIITNDFGTIPFYQIQYFDFGTGKQFISMSDPSQGLSYIYDMQGELLTIPPLEATSLEITPGGSEAFQLYFVSGHSLTIQPLQ